jgi:hypothetical protein
MWDGITMGESNSLRYNEKLDLLAGDPGYIGLRHVGCLDSVDCRYEYYPLVTTNSLLLKMAIEIIISWFSYQPWGLSSSLC